MNFFAASHTRLLLYVFSLGIKIELPDQEPDDDDDVKPNPMDSLSVEMKVRGFCDSASFLGF